MSKERRRRPSASKNILRTHYLVRAFNNWTTTRWIHFVDMNPFDPPLDAPFDPPFEYMHPFQNNIQVGPARAASPDLLEEQLLSANQDENDGANQQENDGLLGYMSQYTIKLAKG